jgi:hypothetical protein
VLIVGLYCGNGAFHENFIAFFGGELEGADGAHEVGGFVAGCVDSLRVSVENFVDWK